jgi:toxin ParE1/3/4
MKFRIAPSARHGLREIAAYIARDNPERAESFIRELGAKIRSVAVQPLIYPSRDEWQAGLRSALHHRYHIVFRIDNGSVVILRVLHGARDIEALF